MLTPEQQERLEALKRPWCSLGLVRALYGLDLEVDEALLGAFRSWALGRRRPLEALRPGEVHRHHLETFLQVEKLLPMKLAAARLGMDADSLAEVEEALRPRGFYLTSPLSQQLAMEARLRGVTRYLPAVSAQIYSDHDDFCSSLHETLAKELDLHVKALRCVTSVAWGEQPPQYAYEFDAITIEPVGIRYQVWLDFKKPMHLKPDCCALKTYRENEELLRGHVLSGHMPKGPASLEHP
jgi:hypothetical protein